MESLLYVLSGAVAIQFLMFLGGVAIRVYEDNLFTRGLEIIPMVGDHLSMIRSHHATLAPEMNEVLKRDWPVN